MKYSEELKEIIKQALLSTYNVISDNLKEIQKKTIKIIRVSILKI